MCVALLTDNSAKGAMPLFELLVPTDEAIVDLSLQRTDDGVLNEPPSTEVRAVSDRTTLEAIESALLLL